MNDAYGPTLPYVSLWLCAFLITVAVEVPIVTFLFRNEMRSVFRRAALAFSAQLISHPIVCFVFCVLPFSRQVQIGGAEVWAFGSEALFYFLVFPPVRLLRACAVSLIANGASFALGEVLQALGLWT